MVRTNGAMVLHGPHHDANTSTTTNGFARIASRSSGKFCSRGTPDPAVEIVNRQRLRLPLSMPQLRTTESVNFLRMPIAVVTRMTDSITSLTLSDVVVER